MVIWKTINGFERYSVSSSGDVRNNERNTLVKPMISTSGYFYVHLVKERKKYTRYVHRLVGQAFLNNPNNCPQIDHIDGNKFNNSINNLRWVTVSQNALAYGSYQRKIAKYKQVKAVNLNGSEIIFESRLAAAEHFNVSSSHIRYNRLYKKGRMKDWILNLV